MHNHSITMSDISVKKENSSTQNDLKLINQKELIAKCLKSLEEQPSKFDNNLVSLIEFHAEGMPNDAKIECFRRIIKTVISTYI